MLLLRVGVMESGCSPLFSFLLRVILGFVSVFLLPHITLEVGLSFILFTCYDVAPLFFLAYQKPHLLCSRVSTHHLLGA